MHWTYSGIIFTIWIVRTHAQVEPYYQDTAEVKELLRQIVNPACVWLEVPEDKRYAQPVAVLPGGEILVWSYTVFMNCPSDRDSWSNAVCACVDGGPTVSSVVTPARKRPCNYLANLRLDTNTKNYTDDYRFVTSGSSQFKASLADLTVPDASTDTGYSLHLTGVPLGFQEFSGNELQGNWRAELSVRPSSYDTMIVLSNDCSDEKTSDGDSDKKRRSRPSLTMSLDSSLVLTVRFSDDKVAGLTCGASANSRGWYPVVVESVNFNITVTVNGNPCDSSIYSVNPLWRTECKLYLGGRDGNSEFAFDGFVDYFRFIRDPHTCDV